MTLHVLYLVHDLADPAVRRRVLMLSAGGARVTLAGFRRGDNALAAVEGLRPIELGVTADGRFAQRLGAVGKACISISRELRDVARPDVIIARNLEMLAVANRAVTAFGGRVPIVYESLDIHRLLLRGDFVGRVLRGAEARLGRKAKLLITSSPAFVENYFRPLSGLDLPVLLLQNQVLALGEEDDAPPPARQRRKGDPWRVGWFGALRCSRSLAMLSTLSRVTSGRVEIVLRGRPARSELKDFDDVVAAEPYMTFEGPYRNPEDLPAIYAGVDFVWTIDFFEEGQNSTWLLPNRLYEGCRHGAVPIALAGTETAHFLEDRKIGLVLPDADGSRLQELFEGMDEESYRHAFEAVAKQHPSLWSVRRDDCEAFVRRLATLSTNTDGAATVAVTRSPTYRDQGGLS
ncbi:glycosyl transferase family 1 [Ciceribacter azotifigens]|uniref:glycosyl transferase family 1 n=1 Tax=Ciceribacter azotifigens TaxID=2069303 RepID=UPI003A85ECD8